MGIIRSGMANKIVQIAVDGTGQIVALMDTGELWVRVKYMPGQSKWTQIELPPQEEKE